MKDRLIGAGKMFTIGGVALSGAIGAAYKTFEASGYNVSSWVPYAVAGGAGAVMAVGAYMKPKTK